MNWRRMALLPLVLALGSCSSDGGSSGTGLAAVQGNVQSVQTAPLEGIRVTVEGTSAADETDRDGFFVVRGDFEGFASLLFERAQDGIAARIGIIIPAGGTLTLSDMRIEDGEVSAETQHVVFEGLIGGTDCAGQTITLVSRSSPDADSYVLRLPGSMLRDRRGNSLACTDLREGARVAVEGAVNEDGTFGAATVEVQE